MAVIVKPFRGTIASSNCNFRWFVNHPHLHRTTMLALLYHLFHLHRFYCNNGQLPFTVINPPKAEVDIFSYTFANISFVQGMGVRQEMFANLCLTYSSRCLIKLKKKNNTVNFIYLYKPQQLVNYAIGSFMTYAWEGYTDQKGNLRWKQWNCTVDLSLYG